MTTHYIGNGASLVLNSSACNGCGMCAQVCPHAVFELVSRKAVIRDKNACMECGACARNCPSGAITVTAGVGCAAAIINGMISGEKPSCDCGCGTTKKKSACCG